MSEPAPVRIAASEDIETFRSVKPHTRFNVHQGRDVWHQTLHAQVRLEKDGTVFISTQGGHGEPLQIRTMPFTEFYQALRAIASLPSSSD